MRETYFRINLPSQGPKLHDSSIVAFKPEQCISLGPVQLHKSPPAGAGLSQYLNFLLIPGPQIALHSEKASSLHPPLT